MQIMARAQEASSCSVVESSRHQKIMQGPQLHEVPVKA